VLVKQHRQLLSYELGHWPSTPAVDSIYRRSSSILKVKDATAPTMLIHGYGLEEFDTFLPAYGLPARWRRPTRSCDTRSIPPRLISLWRDNTKQMLQDMLAVFRRVSEGSPGPAGENWRTSGRSLPGASLPADSRGARDRHRHSPCSLWRALGFRCPSPARLEMFGIPHGARSNRRNHPCGKTRNRFGNRWPRSFRPRSVRPHPHPAEMLFPTSGDSCPGLHRGQRSAVGVVVATV